ncbi:hypothetical protein OIU77_004749 [Salix suchowensis]|uniref:Uncharacterized protein n=1 Tax=Salix suchowensis TaxID=1278906 RepID=A0ABQ9AYB8_9ROSI|nr:hypothetical protein OIU77_004749 [Salix suchowensis]
MQLAGSRCCRLVDVVVPLSVLVLGCSGSRAGCSCAAGPRATNSIAGGSCAGDSVPRAGGSGPRVGGSGSRVGGSCAGGSGPPAGGSCTAGPRAGGSCAGGPGPGPAASSRSLAICSRR